MILQDKKQTITIAIHFEAWLLNIENNFDDIYSKKLLAALTMDWHLNQLDVINKDNNDGWKKTGGYKSRNGS